jgi:hypothetical protein
MTPEDRSPAGAAGVGLCATCAHARRITSARRSVFWFCAKAATDPRFNRYPRLPVLGCPGYERATQADAGRTGEEPRQGRP